MLQSHIFVLSVLLSVTSYFCYTFTAPTEVKLGVYFNKLGELDKLGDMVSIRMELQSMTLPFRALIKSNS